ncbi:hypothetical protein [Nocardia caishijiensis]|uniref:hypothetical protein n=1 Tax=Nocardia caishijiensis TaxID=184756 RepID=UPI0008336EB0|nr:hypothetical protein [Nocardia caishijiensis]
MYGPQSPSAFCNGPTAAEAQGAWIVEFLDYLHRNNITRVPATPEAEQRWGATRSDDPLMSSVSQGSLRSTRIEPPQVPTCGFATYQTRLTSVAHGYMCRSESGGRFDHYAHQLIRQTSLAQLADPGELRFSCDGAAAVDHLSR